MMMPERAAKANEEPLLAELTYDDLPSFLQDTVKYYALGHIYLRTNNPSYRVGQEGRCEIALPVMGDRLGCYAQVVRRVPEGVMLSIQRWEPEHAEQLWRFVAIAWPMLRESGFEQFKGPAPTPAARVNIKGMVSRAEKAHIQRGIKHSIGGEPLPTAAANYLRAVEEEISQISEITEAVYAPEPLPKSEPEPKLTIPDPFGGPPMPGPRRSRAPRGVSKPARETPKPKLDAPPEPPTPHHALPEIEDGDPFGTYRFDKLPSSTEPASAPGMISEPGESFYRHSKASYLTDPEAQGFYSQVPVAEERTDSAGTIYRYTPASTESDSVDDPFSSRGQRAFGTDDLDDATPSYSTLDDEPSYSTRGIEYTDPIGRWDIPGDAPDIDSPEFDQWAAGLDDLGDIYRYTPERETPANEFVDPSLWPGGESYRRPSKPGGSAAIHHYSFDESTQAANNEADVDGFYSYAKPVEEVPEIDDWATDEPSYGYSFKKEAIDEPVDELEGFSRWSPSRPGAHGNSEQPVVIRYTDENPRDNLELTPDPFNLNDLGIEPPVETWPSHLSSEARHLEEAVVPPPYAQGSPPAPAFEAPLAPRIRPPNSPNSRVSAPPTLRGIRWNLHERGLGLLLADHLSQSSNGWMGVIAGNSARRLRFEDGVVVQIEQRPRPDLRLLTTAAASLNLNHGIFTELADLLSQDDCPEERLVELGKMQKGPASRLLARRLSIQLSRAIDEGWQGEAVMEEDLTGAQELPKLVPPPKVPMARLIWTGLRSKTDRSDGRRLVRFLTDVRAQGMVWAANEPFPIDDIEPRGLEKEILQTLRGKPEPGIDEALAIGATKRDIAATVWCLVQLKLIHPPRA